MVFLGLHEKSNFVAEHSDYGYAGEIDSIRAAEFSRLSGVCYLDHAGAALHSELQLRTFTDELNASVLGNPHSQSPGSAGATTVVESARDAVLRFFGTNAKHYSVVFTSGCTAALKLVGECFPWSSGGRFVHTAENHNSVLGIREYASRAGATVSAVDQDYVLSLRFADASTSGPSLVAVAAENNFSGTKFPLEAIRGWHDARPDLRGRWAVLLDAAAYVSHAPLDLSLVPADFVAVSFYKIFGFPTGLGALLVRNESASLLRKTYFGGGTVAASLASEPFHALRPGVSERFEDGTVSFLTIAALRHGFDAIERLGGIGRVMRHTHVLCQELFDRLDSLRHANGRRVCVVYGDHAKRDVHSQGPVLTFNLLRANGGYVGYHEVGQLAALNGIHLRTGCFCNPGACQRYLELSPEDVKRNLEAGHVCWDDKDIMRGRPTGAVRVSLGYASSWEDVQTFVDFLLKYFVDQSVADSSRATAAPVAASDAPSALCLTAINLYPIKSCAKFPVARWPITSHGLLFDREWVLVDPNGAYLNQKKVPRMCLIRPSIDLPSACMTLTAPGAPPLVVPLQAEPDVVVKLSVCGDSCEGFAYSPEVNRWFSDFLRTECSLVRMPQEPVRVAGARGVRSSLNRSGPPAASPSSATILTPVRPADERASVSLPPVRFSDFPADTASPGDTPSRNGAFGGGGNVFGRPLDALRRRASASADPSVPPIAVVSPGAAPCPAAGGPGGAAAPTESTDRSGAQAAAPARIAFSNESQFLLVTEASVAAVRARLSESERCVDTRAADPSGWSNSASAGRSADVGEPCGTAGKRVTPDSFRPNFVVGGGCLPFEEDSWATFSIGSQKFKTIGPCNRCKMVCIDQSTGVETAEPLRTLASFRRDKGKIMFGSHLEHVASDSAGPCVVSVGDPLVVLTDRRT